jgi:hypothetical protein
MADLGAGRISSSKSSTSMPPAAFLIVLLASRCWVGWAGMCVCVRGEMGGWVVGGQREREGEGGREGGREG